MIEITEPVPSAPTCLRMWSVDLHCVLPWIVDGDEVGELHRGRRFYHEIVIDDASAEEHRKQMSVPGNWVEHHRKRQI